jgi:threonine dehydrogenase-like Zn-dependent dehydrogenase
MGVVEAVGPQVERFARGDRVVVAFDIACGRCWFCRRGQTQLCEDFRNLGAGIFGGGLGGAQAERIRVPCADTNLLAVPDDVDDERALFLGDVLTTGFYGAAISGIGEGDTVAVVGAGPVGFFSVQAALVHGAGQVLALDRRAIAWPWPRRSVPWQSICPNGTLRWPWPSERGGAARTS